MKKYIYSSMAFFAFIGINQLQAQDLGTKTIDVVKAYTPTIADAAKPREQAPAEDSLTLTKKKINYTIYSVPVASTFVPEKGKATKVIRQNTQTYNNSYARLGGGSYGTVLGDAYVYLPLDRENSVFVSGEHYSSQGGIKNVIPDNNFSDSDLQVGYDYKGRELQWGATADAFHRLYNWYGIKTGVYSNTFIEDHISNPSHTYLGGGVSGYVSTNSFFRRMDISARLMRDDYKSSEFEVNASPNFIFDLSQDYFISAVADVKYLNGGFNKNFEGNSAIDYQWLEVSAKPSFVLNQGDFNVKLGGMIGFISGKDKSYTQFYPNVNASLRLIDDYAIAYGGAEGGTQLNSYKSLTDTNPYVSPTLDILPTFNDYTAFLGLKGNLDSNLVYNVQLFYGGVTQMALFVPNVNVLPSSVESYQYHNSFNVSYDNGNFFGVKAEVEGDIAKTFFFGLGGGYQSYQMKGFKDNVPNIPNLTFNVNTDFKIFEKLFFGADMLYLGDRKSYDYLNYGFVGGSVELKTLKGYVDLRLHTDYNIDKKWSIFVKANNLLNNSYDNWLYYPAQGLQILGGVTYQFKN